MVKKNDMVKGKGEYVTAFMPLQPATSAQKKEVLGRKNTPQSSPSESFFKNVHLISFRARVGTLKTVKAADDSGEVSGTESNF